MTRGANRSNLQITSTWFASLCLDLAAVDVAGSTPIFGVVNSAVNCRRHRWHIRNHILTAIITEQWGFIVINTGS
jgi:hypothetical protein